MLFVIYISLSVQPVRELSLVGASAHHRSIVSFHILHFLFVRLNLERFKECFSCGGSFHWVRVYHFVLFFLVEGIFLRDEI